MSGETAATSSTIGAGEKISVLTADDASIALGKVTAAIELVAGGRAELGAVANRLEYTVSNLMNVAEYTTAARSRIEDADFAAESARLAKGPGAAADGYGDARPGERIADARSLAFPLTRFSLVAVR